MEKTFDEKFDKTETQPLSKGKNSGVHVNNTHLKNVSYNKYTISDTRRTLSQYCASGALSLLMISFGTTFGFSTILIGDFEELRKKDEDFISLSALTWMSSINNLAILIGALFSGLISQWLGRRNSLMVSTLPFVASWILLSMCGSTQFWPVYLGLLLVGFSGGIIESPMQVYVSEISEPRHRGALSASVGVTITLGVFIEIFLGKYFDWRRLALINISFPILAFVSLYFVPESPYWLASKGRYEESLKALAWLRGWSPVSQLPQNEFQDIISVATKKSDKSSSIKRYFKRTTIIPFALVNFTFLISCFNGSVSVLTWVISIFKDQLRSPLNEHTAAIILTAIQLLATVAIMILLPYFGKRIATLGSLAGTGVCLLYIAGDIFYYGEQSTQSRWGPTIALLSAIAFSFLGIKNVPWILAGELFISDVRSQMAGLLAGCYQIYSAIATKTYIYTKDTLTLSGTFLFFACVNFIGFIVLYFFMPETEGKSLADIEKYVIERQAEKKKKKSLSKISKRVP